MKQPIRLALSTRFRFPTEFSTVITVSGARAAADEKGADDKTASCWWSTFGEFAFLAAKPRLFTWLRGEGSLRPNKPRPLRSAQSRGDQAVQQLMGQGAQPAAADKDCRHVQHVTLLQIMVLVVTLLLLPYS